MTTDNQMPPLADDFLKSVNEIQRSSWTSIIFLVIGGLVVIGSFVFSLTQLNPLKRQVDEKKSELNAVQGQLELARNEVQQAQDKLEKSLLIPNLPPDLKTAIEGALNRIKGANNSLEETQKNLADSGVPPATFQPSSFDDLFSDQPAVRVKAYRSSLDELTSNPTRIPELLKYARAHQVNEDGIYNTLVVLSHLNRDLLKPYVTEIRTFCQELQSGQIGPRIKDRIDKLLSRLPNNTAN